MNIAIIGCGKHAENFHIPSLIRLKKKFNILGIYDPSDLNSNRIISRFKIKKKYKSLKDLYLDKNVNIVDICSPPALHYNQILNSLKNNKHVMVEKPFVLKSHQVEKIIKISNRKKLKIMCLQHQRFRSETKELIKFLEFNKKKLGNLYLIKSKATYLNGIPKQTNYSFTNKKLSGGGPLLDHGSHIIDLIIYLTNLKKITNIESILFYNFFKKKIKIFNVEEKAKVSFLIDKKIKFYFDTSYLSDLKKDYFYIKLFFQRGTIQWPNLRYKFFVNNKILKGSLKYKKNKASDNEFTNFYNYVKRKEKCLVSLRHTKKLVEIIETIYKNSKKKIHD